MKIFEDIEEINIKKKTVVAIGGFDGIHIGHKKVIETAKKRASERIIPLCVFTFPHPAAYYMNSEGFLGLLIDTEEKKDLMEKMGADFLIMVQFDKHISSLSPDMFVKDILVGKLNCSVAVVGFNFRFGKNRIGDTSTLEKLGQRYGFEVEVIKPVKVNGVVVSSSEIRNTLKRGAITDAHSMLGRYPIIKGTIIDERKTLSLNCDPKILLPAAGTYRISTVVDGKRYFGLMIVDPYENTRVEIKPFDLYKHIGKHHLRIEILENERLDPFQRVDEFE